MTPREAETEQIWSEMVNAERAARYCEKVADRMKFRHLILTVCLTVSAVGAVAPLLDLAPEIISKIAFLLVAVLSIGFSLADFSGKAATSRMLGSQYRDLVVDWQRLWYGRTTQEEISSLKSRFNQIDKGVDVGTHGRLNEQATDEAERVLGGSLGRHSSVDDSKVT